MSNAERSIEEYRGQLEQIRRQSVRIANIKDRVSKLRSSKI